MVGWVLVGWVMVGWVMVGWVMVGLAMVGFSLFPPPPPAQESICQNPGGNILFCMGLTAALTQ